jgi:guanylate kinase
MIANGEFLEWADVFGNFYGTHGPATERLLAAGRDVILVIDVQGAQQVRDCGLAFISIFVLPPSFTVLEQRLRGRSKDSEGAIRRRLEVASSEVSSYHDYDYVIVNDDLESAVDQLRAIVLAERARVNRMRPVADTIVNTFPKRDVD